jgi:hypothetical protein
MLRDFGLVFGETITTACWRAGFLLGLPGAALRIIEQAGAKR